MGYPILRGSPQGDALVVLDGSILRVILSLRNVTLEYSVAYHENVTMIIQSLGSTGYLQIVAHSITTAIHSDFLVYVKM